MTAYASLRLGFVLVMLASMPAVAQSQIHEVGVRTQAQAIKHIPPHQRSEQQQLTLAEAHYRAGRLDKASRHAADLLKRHPRNADAWRIQGDVARERGDWTQALKAYERAAKAASRRADIELLRGQALMALGREREADRAFARYRVLTRRHAASSADKK